MMFVKDFSSESFGAAPIRQYPWETLVKISSARSAKEFTGPEIKIDLSVAKTLMTDPAIESIFKPKLGGLTIRAVCGQGITELKGNGVQTRNIF